MATIRPLTVEAVNYRVNGLLARRLWALIKPYWGRREAWPAWIVLAVLLGAVLVSSFAGAAMAYSMKDLTDALIARDQNLFAPALIAYLGWWGITYFLPILMGVGDTWLDGHWRRWMTAHMIDRYLEARTYYDIALKDDLDNPDQRLQESAKPLIMVLTRLPRQVLTQLGTVIASATVLIGLDPTMAWMILGFGIVQVVVQSLVLVPTIKLEFQSTVAEADLRYGLTHVREHAEAIAFYHGEPAERAHIFQRLGIVIRRQVNAQFYQQVCVPFVTNLFLLVWVVIPYWWLSPRVFAGELTFGSIAQASTATLLVQSALTMLFSSFIQQLATAAPPAVRLAQVQERLQEVKASRSSSDERLAVRQGGNAVRLIDVSLQTPGGEQRLVDHLSLTVEPGTNLAIVGQTGVGKSSLLRAMAGLWTRGHGVLEMPAPEHCLFLPQRPYMILADLRSQLLYPHADDLPDDRLIEILEAVNLRHVVEKHGGLSAIRDWGRVLSLGEQQRVAFARVMASQPRFVFLDEATSAVDYATETRLYSLLEQSGASYISIGHRLSILDHHTHVLTLETGGRWGINPRAEPVSPGNSLALSLLQRSDSTI